MTGPGQGGAVALPMAARLRVWAATGLDVTIPAETLAQLAAQQAELEGCAMRAIRSAEAALERERLTGEALQVARAGAAHAAWSAYFFGAVAGCMVPLAVWLVG